jgi:hypothetical protein
VKALRDARGGAKKRPILQILDYIPEPIVDHTRTDVFREDIDYCESLKSRVAEARRIGVDAVRASERNLGSLHDVSLPFSWISCCPIVQSKRMGT